MRKKLAAFLVSCMVIAFGAAGLMTAKAQTPAQEMSVRDVNFTNYAGWAGECIAVDLGVPLGADWTDLTQSHGSYVALEDENGTAYTITLLDVQNTYLLINRNGNYTPALGDVLTLKEGLTINGYELTKDTVYVYETANQPWVYRSDAPITVVPLTVAQVQDEEYDNVHYSFDWDKVNYGTNVIIRFDTSNWDGDLGTFADISSYNEPFVVLTDGFGNVLELNDVTYLNNGHLLIRTKTAAEKLYAGGTIELKAGFSVKVGQVAATLENDLKYICKGEIPHQMPTFSADMIPTSVTILNEEDDMELGVSETLEILWATPAGTYGEPIFTLSDPTKATVDANGVVTGVAVGDTVLTVTVAGYSDTFNITVVPERVVVGVEIVNPYTLYVLKGETAVFPELYAKPKFDSGKYGKAFLLVDGDNATFPTVDTGEVGEQTVSIEILYKEASYGVDYLTKVYEPIDFSVYQIASMYWFNYALFIQYPNCSRNVGNITNVDGLTDVLNRITYERADGTVVEPRGYYVLSHNIVIFYFENLNDDNYKDYYLPGDTITLEAGLAGWLWTGEVEKVGDNDNALKEGTGMFIKESVLRQTIQYRYNGNVWNYYREYTDFIAVEEEQSVGIGRTARADFSRVPSDATSGTITYSSSDTAVATVSVNGVIQGLKAGTTTITATISGGEGGEITRSITVTVFDYITGLKFDKESLNFKVGDTFNVAASLSANYLWASGRVGDAVDLTDATVSGLDLTEASSGMIVISVVKDGETISGRIQATVSEGSSCSSCGSFIHGSVPITAVAIFAVIFFTGRRLFSKTKKN